MFSTFPWRILKIATGNTNRLHIISDSGKVIAKMYRPNGNEQGDARLLAAAMNSMKWAHILAIKYGNDDEKKRVLKMISDARGQSVDEKEDPNKMWNF